MSDRLAVVGAVLVAVVLTAIATRYLWPRVEPLPAPPAVAETAYVTPEAFAGLVEGLRSRIASLTNDRPNQADTVWQTRERVVNVCEVAAGEDPDTGAARDPLPTRWYASGADLPTARGDSANYNLRRIGVTAGGLLHTQERLERHPFPPGPLLAFNTDADGLSVRYGEWPTPRSPFQLSNIFSIPKLGTTVGACTLTGLVFGLEKGLVCGGGGLFVSWVLP